MDLIDYSDEQRLSREEAAARLRDLADQLARHNQISFDNGGLKTTVPVPDEVTLGLEVEVGDDGSEIEIEISW